jgi:hypothetical protein
MPSFWHGVLTPANPWKSWGGAVVSKPTVAVENLAFELMLRD